MGRTQVTAARSEPASNSRWPGIVLRFVGVAAVVSGGVVLAIVVWRFLLYSGDGGVMNDPGGAWAITRVTLLTVAAGITILSVARKREPRATPLWVIAGGCVLGLVVLAPFALANWYPTSEFATVVAYDAKTGAVLWETTTPATQLFAMTGTADELAVVARIDGDRCGGFRFVTLRIDPASGQIVGTTPGGDEHGPYVGGGPYEEPAEEANGMRWDVAARRIVSDRGWSIQADPIRGNVPALVTPDVVYLGLQGRKYLSCSY